MNTLHRRAIRYLGLALCAWVLAWVSPAWAQPVMGLHTASWHSNAAGQNNANGGLYVRGDDWTVGAYRNSLGRTSVYAARTWQAGGWDIAVGAITGYRRKLEPAGCLQMLLAEGYAMDVAVQSHAAYGPTGCNVWRGHGRRIEPLIAISHALPAVGGVVPRITYIPARLGAGSSDVMHLSIERSF